MAAMMDLAPKASQKLLIKCGDCNKIYVTKLKAIYFLLFYRDVTWRKSTIMNRFLVTLKIILRPWSQPMRIYLINISSTIIFL